MITTIVISSEIVSIRLLSKGRQMEERRLIGLLGGLVDEGLVNVRDHTTSGDGSLDEGVKLLVTTDGELKVAGSDTLHLLLSGRGRGRLNAGDG